MENKLKFSPLLPLREMALRKVVILFWSAVDNRLVPTEEWSLEVEDKVSKLIIPKELIEQAIDLVEPIGSEISRWKFFHSNVFHLLLDFSVLSWTLVGQIDDKKTALNLARSDIPVETRYKLACYYCLEDYIPILWEALSQESKDQYSNSIVVKYDGFESLVYDWPQVLSNELCKLDYFWAEEDRILTSFNQWAFEYAAINVTKAAAQYFFEKMTLAERETSLMRCAYSVFDKFSPVDWCFDVSCYLLSLMTSAQQREMVEKYPIAIVLQFLFYPAQDLYIQNASFVWTYFPPSKYYELLHGMWFIFDDKPAKYFLRFFREFFIQSPDKLKKCFVNEFSGFFPARNFLSFFFKSANSESIEVIFKNIDTADKLMLVSHHEILNIFYTSVLDNKCDMVKLCLQQATLSVEEKMRWKEEFAFYVLRIRSGQIDKEDPKWKWFFD